MGLRQEGELIPVKGRKGEKNGALFYFDISELFIFSLKEKKEAGSFQASQFVLSIIKVNS